MALIKRDAVPPPKLKREAVEIAELKGSVIVRGVTLRERLRLREMARSDAAGAGDDFVSSLLALVVLDADDKPLFTAEQWDTWGTDKPASFGALLDKALELGGFNGSASKND
jgi:hypothetical protein